MVSWASRLFWRSSALLGLDLADAELRLVELRQQSGRLTLALADTQPLPADCLEEGNIRQFDTLVLALRQLLERHGPGTRELAMALPAAAVRRATWLAPPGLKEAALDDWVNEQTALHWSTGQQPLSLDYGYWPEHRPADATLLPSAGLAQVWVAAAPLEMVQDRQGLAEACGLQLTALEDGADASARAWHRARAACGLTTEPEGACLAQDLWLFQGLRLGPGLNDWPAEPQRYAAACGLSLRALVP